jgi:hypothetical protein
MLEFIRASPVFTAASFDLRAAKAVNQMSLSDLRPAMHDLIPALSVRVRAMSDNAPAMLDIAPSGLDNAPSPALKTKTPTNFFTPAFDLFLYLIEFRRSRSGFVSTSRSF